MAQHTTDFDVLVIGGGINGVAVAADAAGRGLKVGLYEMSDLASATSSASSKLIHGGLRYLEHYEFRLVGEALAEREVLLKSAPHLVAPMRFRLPHRPHLRPAWMIRIGLFMYDNLGKRVSLPSSHSIKFDQKSPLKPIMSKGFEYSDCAVDDARLVVMNALLAQEKGAHIETKKRCVAAKREQGIWKVTLQNMETGLEQQVTSKALVNAAGPWVASLFKDELKLNSPRGIRLVKGSHILVPKLHDEGCAYILQNEDNRIVFVIPYMEDYSLIGTTDVEYTGDPAKVAISDEEIDYLCDIVNQHFKQAISSKDVVGRFSGVRPLCDDESSSAQAVTRDYTLEIEDFQGEAPLLSIFGGKLTTYRKLGEAALGKLAPYFPQHTTPWTKSAVIPGGNFTSREMLLNELAKDYPWMDKSILKRWVRSYGTISRTLLAGKSSLDQLGTSFTRGLYETEVDYLIEHEWAKNSDDILWRRTKLGLAFTAQAENQLTSYIQHKREGAVASPAA